MVSKRGRFGRREGYGNEDRGYLVSISHRGSNVESFSARWPPTQIRQFIPAEKNESCSGNLKKVLDGVSCTFYLERSVWVFV